MLRWISDVTVGKDAWCLKLVSGAQSSPLAKAIIWNLFKINSHYGRNRELHLESRTCRISVSQVARLKSLRHGALHPAHTRTSSPRFHVELSTRGTAQNVTVPQSVEKDRAATIVITPSVEVVAKVVLHRVSKRYFIAVLSMILITNVLYKVKEPRRISSQVCESRIRD